tara:strand:- start:68 stop:688 length:621 start_codon:yes stop_codon:yes gene_type:complete
MNIYNNLPYDIQFKIDGMLLKEHNDKNTSSVIEEFKQRQKLLCIYDEIVDKRPHMIKDVKMEWIFKEVMTWGLYGGKTMIKNGNEYKSKYERIFPYRHTSINKHIEGLEDYIYNGKSFICSIDFKNSVRVAITWYLKNHFPTSMSIYKTLVDFNLHGIIDVLHTDYINEIIDNVAYELYRHFEWVLDNVVAVWDYNTFIDEFDDDY